MATTIAIVGKSGSGKSTSIMYLNPDETYIINADKKDLPFPGKHKKYNSEKRNYSACSDIKKIEDLILNISKQPHIKTIIIDTMNAVMVDDEMARMKEKNFDKWTDLAQRIYHIIVSANEIPRRDLFIIFMFHAEEYRDDTGYIYRRILTNGTKLSKIVLESKLPTVLFSVIVGKQGKNEHYFETQASDSTGKSPLGMFDSFLIPNNLQLVIDKHREYDELEEEPDQINEHIITPETVNENPLFDSNYEKVMAWIGAELDNAPDPIFSDFLQQSKLTDNTPDNEERCRKILENPKAKEAFTNALTKFKQTRKA